MEIIFANPKLCRHCYTCVRVCPVKAISFQNGKVTIDRQDCILCGNCVQACTIGAIITYNDIPVIKNWLANNEQTAAIVDPSFAASFEDQPGTTASCKDLFLNHPLASELSAGLRRLGFSMVINTDCSAAIYAGKYQKLLAAARQQPVISSFCPAIVALVERHFPELINYLAPVKSPMMLTGQWVKKIYPACKTIFIGPCLAKKGESIAGHAGTSIDAVINFSQLKQWFKRVEDPAIQKEPGVFKNPPANDWDFPESSTTRLLPLAGGLLKTLGLYPDVGSLEIIVAHAPVKCTNLLRFMTNGSLKPVIADLLCCDGCISGPQIAHTDSCFEKTKRVVLYSHTNKQFAQKQKAPARWQPNLDINLDTKRSFIDKHYPKQSFSEKQIWQTLQQIDKYTTKDLNNCKACGYSSCREYAIAVLRSRAEQQMCLPFLLKQFKKSHASLEQRAVTDSLTGLYNHRWFQGALDQYITSYKKNNEKFALFLIDIDHFKKMNDQFGHQSGDLLLADLAALLRDFFANYEDSFVARYGGEEFIAVVPKTTGTVALNIGKHLVETVKNYSFHLPMITADLYLTVSVGIACFPTNATDKNNLLKLADHAMYSAKQKRNHAVLYSSVLDEIVPATGSYQESAINTVKTLNIVVNAKDNYTYKHSERVMYYTEVLARQLALPENDIKHLKYGAFIHDIGKINIDMSILLKPGKLTSKEYEFIKQHPVTGAAIAQEIPALHRSILVIKYHHERYDGKGYPEGDIPLWGRIAAIADSFDAMTTKRTYKEAFTYQYAINELIKNSGTQFDPELVGEFIKGVQEVLPG
ncbi:diguanylate cyclase [Peptococcaceae bacterium]|nr:diguanylate cyclase [Peptococcaceae bacterium]